jgi:hypothetical protein
MLARFSAGQYAWKPVLKQLLLLKTLYAAGLGHLNKI